MSNYIHDPQSVVDYMVDWSEWLGAGETISASLFTIPAGLTVDPANPALDTKTSDTATIWLTGGTLNTSYPVRNHITTNQGRQQDQTITLQVRER